MKYALSLAEDGRILSATFEQFATEATVLVDALPEGDISDYRYVDGQYVHDPVPVKEEDASPTQLDRIEAQVAYTAMMTDTLLEV
jgi:hypothetical protein